MKIEQQLPRNALVWMVACLFMLVAPHALRVPAWVLVVYVLAVVWRVQVHRGRWSFPGRWVKVAMSLSAFGGIFASYGTLIGLEPTVALLLTAFALKLTELVRRKDAYVLLFLGYFIVITEFLFSQDILVTLYSMSNVVMVTAALVALHQPGEQRFNWRPLRVSGVMLAQALPLMLVIFFLFPRIGPLWTVPIKSHSGVTGMSDFMKPGDVARLGRSSEVAFRVKFDGEIPARSTLYWRGLVLSRLQDDVWTTLDFYDIAPASHPVAGVRATGTPINYSVILEPTQQNWLFALHYAEALGGSALHTPDFRLYSPVPIESEYFYRVRSWPDQNLEPQLSTWRRRVETQLPPRQNPRLHAHAQALRERLADDAALVDEVLATFAREQYFYTLQPGVLSGRDSMDQFFFDSKRGFCEHYASAFVILMRAAGIPARVVAGYQGGEINPINRTVIVHQFDAHAWAEVWLPGSGWRRVDPTSAVSPDRIEAGLEQAVAQEGSFLADAPLSPLRYRNIPIVNLLRLRYDALTYRWQSWVVGFDNDRQLQLLHQVFGEISTRTFVTVLLGSGVLVLVPVAISLLVRRATRQITPRDRYYLRFCARLADAGLPRAPGEAASDFGIRAAAVFPHQAAQLRRITELYTRLAYCDADSGAEEASLRALKLAVGRFRPGRRGA